MTISNEGTLKIGINNVGNGRVNGSKATKGYQMYDTYIPLLKRNPGFLQIINYSQQSGSRAVGAESSNVIRVLEVIRPSDTP
jgi:hypothetical protein